MYILCTLPLYASPTFSPENIYTFHTYFTHIPYKTINTPYYASLYSLHTYTVYTPHMHLMQQPLPYTLSHTSHIAPTCTPIQSSHTTHTELYTLQPPHLCEPHSTGAGLLARHGRPLPTITARCGEPRTPPAPWPLPNKAPRRPPARSGGAGKELKGAALTAASIAAGHRFPRGLRASPAAGVRGAVAAG